MQPAIAESTPSRLSFAISGGASMGAYEAGLIWGLTKAFRHLEETGDWSTGGNPRLIEIASISGTSAGGINTLLAALAWSVKPEDQGGFTNSIDDNIFRDIWLCMDVNRLLPPTADSTLYTTNDALLARHDLIAVAGKLREKWLSPGTFRPGLRLPLGVAVTRVTPATMTVSDVTVNNQRFYIPFELRIKPDGSVKFGFNPKDYPTLTDPTMILMPWPADAEPYSITDQQVEDALMTTSAFPVGFGRKRLYYCQEKNFLSREDGEVESSTPSLDADAVIWICPEDYELAEAEFADGGLFDNIPVGLARTLAESHKNPQKELMPVRYLYLDPDRPRYETPLPEDKRACRGDNPPAACSQLTHDLASESRILGGAVGTARKSALFRELTSDYWRLNLSNLSEKVADIMDAKGVDDTCESLLPFFSPSQKCSDRLRYTGGLLAFSYDYQYAPVRDPFSSTALLDTGIASDCRSFPTVAGGEPILKCAIDPFPLRRALTKALKDLTETIMPEEEKLINDIHRSSQSAASDRVLTVSDRGGPITSMLLGAFGGFLDYKFREYDYFVGVYDSIITVAANQCKKNLSMESRSDRWYACLDRMSEQLYQELKVEENPKSSYTFARMAQTEFGKEGHLRFAYDPMPPEDRDVRIIHEGLKGVVYFDKGEQDHLKGFLATEREFFEYLKAEGFEPTPSPDGGKPLLTFIMNDPDYWSNELVKRATSRLVYLEKEADSIYRAREPDPEKREQANAGLMGATALALRTATYQYPEFTFSPSVAPESWFWRNLIPYEAAFDFMRGDGLIYWQPTWNLKYTNVGLRLGLGFADGVLQASGTTERERYGTLGLDFTRFDRTIIFSGWGVTPAVYHYWNEPNEGEQTAFGLDIHAYLFKNRLRISLGARDLFHDAGDTLFLTVGLADLPGLIYWLSR